MSLVESKAELQDKIVSRDFLSLRSALNACSAQELAQLINELSATDDIIVFRLLSFNLATETFEFLSRERQEALIEALAKRENRLAGLLNDLSPDERTSLFEELPGHVTQRLLQILAPEERKVSTMLLGYPEDSIGRLMTTDFVAIGPDFTVAQALDHIRKYGSDSETLHMIYVVDKHGRLIDDLRSREILLADPDKNIREIMDERFIALKASEDQETAINVFRDYDLFAIPVTDSKGVLLGIVTVDDVLDVVHEEATEDFHKFGSIQDIIFNPLEASAWFLYRKRIFWLFALVIMNVFSGAAIASFENTIEAVVALVFFLPLLIDSGGNAGSQSATLMVRALATGDVRMANWLQLIGKEILVALLLGLTMAVGVATIASIRAPEVIVIVALTMVCIVIVGSIVGLTLPFVLTRFGRDPATASAPLITSLADISGVIIYFSIANWVLGIHD